jgi:hypothetical protein
MGERVSCSGSPPAEGTSQMSELTLFAFDDADHVGDPFAVR